MAGSDSSQGAFKLAGAFLIACGAALTLTSGWDLITGGTAAIKAGTALPAFFGNAALGVGAGLTGYGIYKAPEWAASPGK